MKSKTLFLPTVLLFLFGCGDLTQHGFPQQVAFAPDGRLVVSLDGVTKILDPTAAAVVESITTPRIGGGFEPLSRRYALSADGTRIAVASAATVTVFATAGGAQVASLTVDDPGSQIGDTGIYPNTITAVALDSGGIRLAVTTGAVPDGPGPYREPAGSGHLRVWDVASASLLLDVAHDPARAGNADWPGGVALSADGATLYGAEALNLPSGDGSYFVDAWRIADGVRLWDTTVSSQALLIGPSFVLGLSPDGLRLAGSAAALDAIYVWSTNDGAQSIITPPAGEPDALNLINDLRFTPDSTGLLVAGSAQAFLLGVDGSLRQSFIPVSNVAYLVSSAALSPDGTRVAGVYGPTLWLWNVTDGSVLSQHLFQGQLD